VFAEVARTNGRRGAVRVTHDALDWSTWASSGRYRCGTTEHKLNNIALFLL
jgi:hypothetical protein